MLSPCLFCCLLSHIRLHAGQCLSPCAIHGAGYGTHSSPRRLVLGRRGCSECRVCIWGRSLHLWGAVCSHTPSLRAVPSMSRQWLTPPYPIQQTAPHCSPKQAGKITILPAVQTTLQLLLETLAWPVLSPSVTSAKLQATALVLKDEWGRVSGPRCSPASLLNHVPSNQGHLG